MEYSKEYVERLEISASKLFDALQCVALQCVTEDEGLGTTELDIEKLCEEAIRYYIDIDRAFSV